MQTRDSKTMIDQEWQVATFNSCHKLKQRRDKQTMEKGKPHTPNRDTTPAISSTNEGINVKIFGADASKYLDQ